jgi:hypothetical protein
VIPLQDAVNKLLADMLVNSEYVAFPQRFATGLEIPTDPRRVARSTASGSCRSVSRLWVAEDPNVKFGQLPRATAPATSADGDADPARRRADAHAAALPARAVGRVPVRRVAEGDRDGARREGQAQAGDYGETWEEAMRLAFLYRGDTVRGAAANAETLWADPESRSEGELVDALIKLQSIGYPLEVLWAMHGESPQQIDRMRRLKALPERPTTPPPPPPPDPTSDGATPNDTTQGVGRDG